MDNMDLNSWIDFLEQPDNCVIELGLDRVSIVAKALDVENFSCPVVTVAGTNGKGSCVASIEAIGLALDKKVGVYTSPHLHDILERIKVNGDKATGDDLCKALTVVKQVADESKIHLTYFEYMTLAALVIFKQNSLELIVLEVGLGGRLDATNVVNNDISIITSIAMDHCGFLGDTLDKIAFEKAGIFKGSSWCIFNNFENSVEVIEQRAKELVCREYRLGKDFSINEDGDTWSWTDGVNSFLNIPLTNFPVQNAALALAAVTLLFEKDLSSRLLSKVFDNFHFTGRYNEKIISNTNFIFDVAHNPVGASWLLQKVKSANKGAKIRAIFHPLMRKDWQSMLSIWDGSVHEWYFIESSDPDFAKAQDLAQHLPGNNFCIAQDYSKVIDMAGSRSDDGDVVVVFGSFHVVATLLQKAKQLAAEGY